jgi:hypothetical protein
MRPPRVGRWDGVLQSERFRGRVGKQEQLLARWIQPRVSEFQFRTTCMNGEASLRRRDRLVVRPEQFNGFWAGLGSATQLWFAPGATRRVPESCSFIRAQHAVRKKTLPAVGMSNAVVSSGAWRLPFLPFSCSTRLTHRVL